ncbi:HpcH/HpaI aldolase [Pseudonocardia dioxanivorans CB1190]|uniref:HpcH/HpaI aldolase n=1 Tax=Pseudonocardia dioxanivorans (strain ATCC 55486 / DSM 44775 / JCM 13855 / CB1190) TaxID=675635 RepID=F4CPH8_PSEUX|nr:aldolase/citrate lyase family protein [Pseudonocardia dioxanivorans]AEA24476.1 HpcH/HpaI aldolase [Pseudonocardia dioxanivorans CB1190]
MRPDQVSLGGWCHLDAAFAVELMASVGFDWCCLDMQHGTIRTPEIVGLLQAVRARAGTALVRVPGGDPHLVGAVLDAGADGIVVPQVSSVEQARAAVAACRYAPHGTRSWGPLTAKLAGPRPEPAELGAARCYVMVEDGAGVSNVADIAAVPGLAGVIVGPADLALDLFGSPYLTSDPGTVEAVAPVVAACRANDIAAGVFCGTGNVGLWRSAGFSMLAVESDSALLLSAARRALAEARAVLADRLPDHREHAR